jgi:hypothetical protein
MPLTQKNIEELKVIYRREYGVEIGDAEAWAMGNRLVRLFDILTRPRNSEEPSEVRTPSRLTELRHGT